MRPQFEYFMSHLNKYIKMDEKINKHDALGKRKITSVGIFI